MSSGSSILHHGEYRSPYYKPILGNGPSWAGRSTDAERPDGQVSGIVRRYKKTERACTETVTMGWVKACHHDAIEYTARGGTGMRGLMMIMGLFGCGISVFAVSMFGDSFAWGDWLFGLITTVVFSLVGVVFVLKTFRSELFCLEDEPTIFDRAQRKVYRIFREVQPGFLGLFKPWPVRICAYDWDLLDCEHTATVTGTGSTVTRYHALVFIVRKSAKDPTIIDSFNIGHSYQLGEPTVPAVWEHIRRYMEENGPALPPGETFAPSPRPQTLLQSLSAVGPFGSNYVQWWKDATGQMILGHLLFPVTIPFFLLWGMLNWLSYKTSVRVDWPVEIREAIGAA